MDGSWVVSRLWGICWLGWVIWGWFVFWVLGNTFV